MKKIRKKSLVYMLVLTLLIMSISGSYFNSRMPESKAHAVAIESTLFIFFVMAACGLGYVSSEVYQSIVKSTPMPDSNGWQERANEVEPIIQALYNELVNQVAANNGYDPNDFDPDNDDPEDKPPLWSQLKEWYLKQPAGTKVAVGGSLLGTIFSSLAVGLRNKIDDGKVKAEDSTMSDFIVKSMLDYVDDFPYVFYFFDALYPVNGWVVVMSPHMPLAYSQVDGVNIEYYNDYMYMAYPNSAGFKFYQRSQPNDTFVSYTDKRKSYFDTNFPIFSSREEALAASDGWMDYPGKLNPHSTLGHLDFDPSQYPYTTVTIPDASMLQDYYNALSNSKSEDELQQSVDNMLNEITSTQPAPDPDPGTNPDPDPGPNPGTDPNPDDGDIDNYKPTLDMTTLFPFCIPFDLIRCFKLFSAEPETPEFHVDLDVGFYKHEFIISLEQFESLAVITRILSTILFIIGLVMVTRKLIKG